MKHSSCNEIDRGSRNNALNSFQLLEFVGNKSVNSISGEIIATVHQKTGLDSQIQGFKFAQNVNDSNIGAE